MSIEKYTHLELFSTRLMISFASYSNIKKIDVSSLLIIPKYCTGLSAMLSRYFVGHLRHTTSINTI